ncbi:Hypothetical predicted protein, partial [Xyrichtys novacula]
MYVYGPSSLANYPASVWERQAFPFAVTAVSASACSQTATVSVPGRPRQSAVSSSGGSGDLFWKSKAPWKQSVQLL